MTLAALYARVSREDQENENQLVDLRDYCSKSGYTIYKEYSDKISGVKDSRPAWDELFFDAHQKKFDVVIFWKLDRFSRSGTLFTLQKLKELENLNISWLSLTEPYFNNIGQFKDVVISIMATLASIEREKIIERTKAGLKLAKNVGKRGPDKKPRKWRSDKGFTRIKRRV